MRYGWQDDGVIKAESWYYGNLILMEIFMGRGEEPLKFLESLLKENSFQCLLNTDLW